MADLTITNNTLRFGSQLFQIHNITQIRIDVWKRNPRIGTGTMLALLLISWVLSYSDPLLFQRLSNQLLSTRLSYSPGLYVLIGLCFFGLFVYGVWDRTKLKQYTLYLETNSGSSKLFSSPDLKGIRKIASAIHNVMENRNTPVSYHVNVDQSKITLGDEFANIGEGATVINRSAVSR
jgi:Family of unknown function (DUF6232)